MDRARAASADVADPADVAAFAAVREICRRRAPGFYSASFFLPRPKRDAAYAAYAFCRMVGDAIGADDDAVAGAAGLREYPAIAPSTRHAVAADALSRHDAAGGLSQVAHGGCGCSESPLDVRLNLLRDRLDEIYSGTLELPRPETRSEAQHALHAFAHTVRRYEVPRQYFLDLAEGHRADLTVSRYATWASLERHCYHVAGVVGLILFGVLGLTHSGAGEQAVKLGNAMRLTGILRDLKADRDRGRLYLPLEDLARFHYGERDLARGVVDDRFRGLMQFEIARARQLYCEGAEGLCWLAGDSSRLAASVTAVVHAGILSVIERQGYDVFAGPVRLTAAQSIRRLPAAWRLARRQPGEELPDVLV